MHSPPPDPRAGSRCAFARAEASERVFRARCARVRGHRTRRGARERVGREGIIFRIASVVEKRTFARRVARGARRAVRGGGARDVEVDWARVSLRARTFSSAARTAPMARLGRERATGVGVAEYGKRDDESRGDGCEVGGDASSATGVAIVGGYRPVARRRREVASRTRVHRYGADDERQRRGYETSIMGSSRRGV